MVDPLVLDRMMSSPENQAQVLRARLNWSNSTWSGSRMKAEKIV